MTDRTPFPALVKRGRWQCDHLSMGGMTGFFPGSGEGHMRVNVSSDEDAARWTRVHEMLHVRWSPFGEAAPADPLEREFAAPLEDLRIHALAPTAGIGPASYETDAYVDLMGRIAARDLAGLENGLTGDTSVVLTGKWLASQGQPRTQGVFDAALRAALKKEFPRTHETVHDRLQSVRAIACKSTDYAEVQRCAGLLADIFRTASAEAERQDGEGDRERDGEGGEALSLDAVLSAYRSHLADGKWGTMTVRRPPLSVPQGLAKWIGSRPKASDEGAVPVLWHRLPVDGAVFLERKRSKASVNVLLDVSGSMNVTRDQIMGLLELSPGATVALYSADAREGAVVVVAEKGKCVREIPAMPGANVIDGPALRWLGEQKGRKLWVCDGVVTGVGDQVHGNLTAEARAICQARGIARVPTMVDARKTLEKWEGKV